jgi:hypothetical protein
LEPGSCNFLLIHLSLKIKKAMKNSIQTAIIVLAGFALISCESIGNKTITGTGPLESMEVELPAFQGVSVTGICNVIVQIGETQSVVFHAQSEILDVLDYAVDDQTLEIGIQKGYSINTIADIRAEITIPGLEFIGVTGAGDFELSGTVQDRLDILITGLGNVEAYDMPVNTCNIRISGTSNCRVHVNEVLDVVISGVGNISYRGNPSVNSDISGVGNVSPDEN